MRSLRILMAALFASAIIAAPVAQPEPVGSQVFPREPGPEQRAVEVAEAAVEERGVEYACKRKREAMANAAEEGGKEIDEISTRAQWFYSPACP